MIEVMVGMVQQPAVPWAVLGLSALIVVIEVFRSSRQVFWGDLLEDE